MRTYGGGRIDYGGMQAGAATANSLKTFTTTFPLTENPMSESGNWVYQGLRDATDWTNVRTSLADDGATHIAYGTQVAHANPPDDDSSAGLSGFHANQSAQGTVYRSTSIAGSHEIELLLRGTWATHSIRLYEIDILSGGGLVIAQWNGALNDFTTLEPQQFVGSMNTGDVWLAQIVGQLITVKCNGSTVMTHDTSTDASPIATGNPGIGFWHVDGTGTNDMFGWKSFTANEL